MPARPVRCAIYTRQSVARPGRDPETSSCALQREACLALIAANAHLGWVAVDERFDDEGESGADTDRLGLLRLVASVAEGLVDRVLVHRLDRLTRRAADWAEIDSILREHDVAISVVDGGIHGATDAITRFRLNALAVFAEFERDMIGERLADARAARRARGLRVAGRVPLGYVADRATKQLVVVPAEAEIVRSMFADADAGMLPAAIATRAKEKGFVDKNGKTGSWSAKAVLRILRNETYAGLLSDGSAGVHEAIVDRALFDRVGEKIAARQTRTPTPRPEAEGTVDPFLLRGLLVCARCGKRMTTSSAGKVARLPISPPPGAMPALRYYRCRGSGCPRSQLPATAIEALVPKLFATPSPDVGEQTRIVFQYVARIWENLIVPNRRRELVALCKEIRWDGERHKLTIIADEVGIENYVESWRQMHAREAAARG
jgi:DNA invertase Pin-like site-specific DNA recombinase